MNGDETDTDCGGGTCPACTNENVDNETPDPEDNPACRPLSSIRSYATLLSRIFGQDVASCQNCGGALRFIACIDERETIDKILTHLGLDTDVQRITPDRSPPQESCF